jgi:hypothetical protein
MNFITLLQPHRADGSAPATPTLQGDVVRLGDLAIRIGTAAVGERDLQLVPRGGQPASTGSR